MRRWVPLATLAACCYNAGTIWAVHFAWRLWRFIGRQEFDAYHHAWWYGWGGIQPVVFPAVGAAGAGTLAQLRWRPPGVPVAALWGALALQVLSSALTGAMWGRWQGQLREVRREDGSLSPLYRRIMGTHWLRVALITASAALQVWVAGRGLEGAPGGRA